MIETIVIVVLTIIVIYLYSRDMVVNKYSYNITPRGSLGQGVKRILFVRGFASQIQTPDSVDVYKHFSTYFEGREEYEVKFFFHTPDDVLADVYQRLRIEIASYKPHILLGHSMGGLLTYNYMNDELDKGKALNDLPRPFIMMGALQVVSDDPLFNLLSALPRAISNNIKLPLGFGFPAAKLQDDGNLLNTDYTFTSIRQLLDAKAYQAETVDELVSNLERMRASVISTDDDFTADMGDEAEKRLASSKLVNYALVAGKHEAFSSRKASSKFFKVFDGILKSI